MHCNHNSPHAATNAQGSQNIKQIKIEFKEAWLRDSILEIENNQLALATYEQDFLNSNKEKLLVN